MCVCVCVAELDRKRAACKQQAINITDWALRPSAYPSVTESDLFDGALHVCVCVCVVSVYKHMHVPRWRHSLTGYFYAI